MNENEEFADIELSETALMSVAGGAHGRGLDADQIDSFAC